jgi:DNA-nicking Smr family endonuclease
VSDSDQNDIWQRAVQDVKPLKNKKKHSPKARKYKRPKAVDHEDFYARMLREQGKNMQSPAAQNFAETRVQEEVLNNPNIDRNTRKRMDAGKMNLDGILDLHNMDREQAFEALVRFVQQSQATGLRLLLVITGKGKGQEQEGVLKGLFPTWLETPHLKPFIVRASQAAKHHGGSGAWYLYLKRN